MSEKFRTNKFLLTVFLFALTFVYSSCAGKKDPLRAYFQENGQLILVNPFYESLPMGTIVRPEGRELRQIDSSCFAKLQDKITRPEAYDFIGIEKTERRHVTAELLNHLPGVDINGSKRVSIEVLDGKIRVMSEAEFMKVVEDPTFASFCSDLIGHEHNYIVYQIVTGRLSYTFWTQAKGKWQVIPVALKGTGQTNKRNSLVQESTSEDVKVQIGGSWGSTVEGSIQMTEPRVLAVLARRWKSGSRGQFGEPMPPLQFRRLRDLNWKSIPPPP
jgi:hypothetical protein